MKLLRIMVIALLAAFSSLPASAADEKYVFAVPMIEGLEATSIVKHIENLSTIMGKKLNANVKSKQLVYTYGDNLVDRIVNEFRNKKADVSYIYGIDYVQYQKSGGKDFIPLFTLTMDKSSLMRECIYVRKGDVATPADLKGKKWVAAHLIPTRYLLYQKGIDEPLEKFFSSIDYMSDAPLGKMVEKLNNKEIDAFTTYSIIMRISGEETKKDSVVEPLFCDIYDHTWIFVARNDVSPQFVEKIRKIMLNAHKDRDFDTFKFAFQIIDGRFVQIDPDALEKIGKVADVINKKGWKKEQDEFYKKYREKKK